MRASASHQPQPLPLPLPPPPLSLPSASAAPRRRHRTASSLSSSSSSSASSFSLSPSPRAASVVPFSWERHPGVPKSSLAGFASSCSSSAPLPLPPPAPPRQSPRRRQHRRHRRAASDPTCPDRADPFAAAFAECTREDGKDDPDKLWPAPASTTVPSRTARRWWLNAATSGGGGGGIIGFLDLHGCKSAMAVAESAFLPRRPPAAAARPGHGRR